MTAYDTIFELLVKREAFAAAAEILERQAELYRDQGAFADADTAYLRAGELWASVGETDREARATRLRQALVQPNELILESDSPQSRFSASPRNEIASARTRVPDKPSVNFDQNGIC